MNVPAFADRRAGHPVRVLDLTRLRLSAAALLRLDRLADRLGVAGQASVHSQGRASITARNEETKKQAKCVAGTESRHDRYASAGGSRCIMPIFLWVVFPFAVWSACMDQALYLAKPSHRFAD